MMSDWEKEIKDKIHNLYLQKVHIIMLRMRLYNKGYALDSVDDYAFHVAVTIIDIELEKLKGELEIEKLLLL